MGGGSGPLLRWYSGIASFEIYQHSDQTRAGDLITWIKQHKPRQIRYLQSSNYIALSIPRQDPGADQWWARLQTFEASFPYPRGTNIATQRKNAGIILNILKQTRNTLTELKLGDITTDITVDQLHLPNLKKLSLMEVSSWWKIVGDGVTEFELWPHNIPPPNRLKITFPKLKTLRYHSGRFAMRGIFIAPGLEILIYHVGKGEGRFIWESDDWEKDDSGDAYTYPGLTPTELHLHGVHVPCAELSRGLLKLSNLEKFHLHSSQVWATFLKSMVGSTLLPKLTEIVVEFGLKDNEKLSREKYNTFFNTIANERDGFHGTMKLDSFKVKWSKGDTTFFVYPPERPISISEWTVVKVSSGRNCHTLMPGSGAPN